MERETEEDEVKIKGEIEIDRDIERTEWKERGLN